MRGRTGLYGVGGGSRHTAAFVSAVIETLELLFSPKSDPGTGSDIVHVGVLQNNPRLREDSIGQIWIPVTNECRRPLELYSAVCLFPSSTSIAALSGGSFNYLQKVNATLTICGSQNFLLFRIRAA